MSTPEVNRHMGSSVPVASRLSNSSYGLPIQPGIGPTRNSRHPNETEQGVKRTATDRREQPASPAEAGLQQESDRDRSREASERESKGRSVEPPPSGQIGRNDLQTLASATGPGRRGLRVDRKPTLVLWFL